MVRLRPGTLRPTSRRIPVGHFLEQAAWSPDRRRIALAVRPPGRIQIVGVTPLARAQTIDTDQHLEGSQLDRQRLGPWFVRRLVWPTRRRLFAVSLRRDGGQEVTVIDPFARRVLRRVRLSGRVIGEGVRAAGDRLAILLAPTQAIGPAELAVVSPTGYLRLVSLPGISAGEDLFRSGRVRIPALAVDPTGREAYVASATEPKIVEVELASGRSTEHSVAPTRTALDRLRDLLDAPAYAKGAEGPERSAELLGGGMLAVSGCDHFPGGNHNACDRPYGLRLIDTRHWTSRTLDARASRFRVTRGAVVVDATGYGKGKRLGLRVFASDGSLAIDVLRGHDVLVQLDTRHVYAHVIGSPRSATRVIDLRTAHTTLLPAGVPQLLPAPVD